MFKPGGEGGGWEWRMGGTAGGAAEPARRPLQERTCYRAGPCLLLPQNYRSQKNSGTWEQERCQGQEAAPPPTLPAAAKPALQRSAGKAGHTFLTSPCSVGRPTVKPRRVAPSPPCTSSMAGSSGVAGRPCDSIHHRSSWSMSCRLLCTVEAGDAEAAARRIAGPACLPPPRRCSQEPAACALQVAGRRLVNSLGNAGWLHDAAGRPRSTAGQVTLPGLRTRCEAM